MSKITDGIASLVAFANKSEKVRSCVGSEISANWRYIDFIDVATGRPCLPLEYLYGTRGYIAGRVVKFEAEKAAGKSSSMFMAYGMAQKTGGCWSLHYDTENAPPPADFMAHLGCDPREVFLGRPKELTSFMESVESQMKMIRTSVDKEKKYPILVGLDSISGIGVNVEAAGTGKGKKKDSNNSGQISFHAREFSKWFREKIDQLEEHDAVLMASAQLKDNIGAGMFASADEQSTTIAGKPFGYHATWVVRLSHARWWDKQNGTNTDLGEVITARCTKNKVNAPNRMIKMHLKSTESGDPVGWDFYQATIDLLTGAFNNTPPFPPDEFKSSGGFYYMTGFNKDRGMRRDDMVDLFLGNPELVMRARQALRVRGFGFPFETDYTTYDQEATNATDT